MTTVVEVSTGGMGEAIVQMVRAYPHAAEAGQLRVTPNPMDPAVYLVIVGLDIVAKLRRRQTIELRVPAPREGSDGAH